MTKRLTGKPKEISSAPMIRIKFFIILGVLGLGFVMGPLAMLVAVTNQPEPLPEIPEQPEGRWVAELAADAYLNGADAPVPAATDVDVSFGRNESNRTPFGATERVWQKFTSYNLSGRTYELHTFAVMRDNKANPVQLTVPVLLTDDGPVLGSPPTLTTLRTAAGQRQPPLTYQDLPQADLAGEARQELQTTVTEWAQAYAAGNQRALYDLTGDNDLNHVYDGLGGFAVVDGSVRILSQVAPGDDTRLFVRVRMTITQPGTAEGEQPPFTATSDVDLLVLDHRTGDPKVAAWGPAGTGPTLTPYSNARTPSDAGSASTSGESPES